MDSAIIEALFDHEIDHVGYNLDVHTAASVGDMEFLLTQDFDLDVKNLGGWTPLMYASYYDHRDLVEFLVTRGAQAVGIANAKGRTPLMLAAMCG